MNWWFKHWNTAYTRGFNEIWEDAIYLNNRSGKKGKIELEYDTYDIDVSGGDKIHMNILSATNTKVKVRKQCDLKLVVNDAPNVAITMGDHINANANFRGEQQDVTTWDSRICRRTCWTTWYVVVVGVIFSIVSSLNNEWIAMLSMEEFLYVLSLKVKHVLRLIRGSGSTWNPIWVLG